MLPLYIRPEIRCRVGGMQRRHKKRRVYVHRIFTRVRSHPILNRPLVARLCPFHFGRLYLRFTPRVIRRLMYWVQMAPAAVSAALKRIVPVIWVIDFRTEPRRGIVELVTDAKEAEEAMPQRKPHAVQCTTRKRGTAEVPRRLPPFLPCIAPEPEPGFLSLSTVYRFSLDVSSGVKKTIDCTTVSPLRPNSEPHTRRFRRHRR